MVIRDLYWNWPRASCAQLKCMPDCAKFLLCFRADVELNIWTDCWRWYSNNHFWDVVWEAAASELWTLTWLTGVAGTSTQWQSNADSYQGKVSQPPSQTFTFCKESCYKTNPSSLIMTAVRRHGFHNSYTQRCELCKWEKYTVIKSSCKNQHLTA